MIDYLAFIEIAPIVATGLIAFLLNQSQNKKHLYTQRTISEVANVQREMLQENIEELEDKIDELRLQVGILSHGTRIIQTPSIRLEESEVIQKKKGGWPKGVARKKTPKIE